MIDSVVKKKEKTIISFTVTRRLFLSKPHSACHQQYLIQQNQCAFLTSLLVNVGVLKKKTTPIFFSSKNSKAPQSVELLLN